jgi:hypothetical protein
MFLKKTESDKIIIEYGRAAPRKTKNNIGGESRNLSPLIINIYGVISTGSANYAG